MADFLQRKEFMQSVPFFHLLAGHTVTHCEHMTKTHRQGKAVPLHLSSKPVRIKSVSSAQDAQVMVGNM